MTHIIRGGGLISSAILSSDTNRLKTALNTIVPHHNDFFTNKSKFLYFTELIVVRDEWRMLKDTVREYQKYSNTFFAFILTIDKLYHESKITEKDCFRHIENCKVAAQPNFKDRFKVVTIEMINFFNELDKRKNKTIVNKIIRFFSNRCRKITKSLSNTISLNAHVKDYFLERVRNYDTLNFKAKMERKRNKSTCKNEKKKVSIIPKKKVIKGGWKDSEILEYNNLLQKYKDHKNVVKKISQFHSTRNYRQIYSRYSSFNKYNYKKGNWAKREDRIILKEGKNRSWTKISKEYLNNKRSPTDIKNRFQKLKRDEKRKTKIKSIITQKKPQKIQKKKPLVIVIDD